MSSLSVVLFCLFFLLTTSCGSELPELKAGSEIPYYVAEGFEQITVSSLGRVEIRASKVEAFQEDDKTVFFETQLTEYDSDGKVLMEGNAKKIELEGNNDAAARGDIYVRDSSSLSIFLTSLAENRQLSAPRPNTVRSRYIQIQNM